ncbi:hypothetical protein [Granulicatella adiacens]|uniref:hypothetical protein n=1 Tax=Granulicatella adiacens TaxID=46124 RepID=UPI004026ED67
MIFTITLNYKVNSCKRIDKSLKYEYHKNKNKFFYDSVEIKNNYIKITGSRSEEISEDKTLDKTFKTLLSSKKSNFRHCILSSLFYLYNYFGKKIKINSIEMYDQQKNRSYVLKDKAYFQEFYFKDIPTDFKIDCKIIENLFKKISKPNISSMLYNLLLSQVMFVRNNDFYYAYRSFNTVYTYMFSYKKNQKNKEDKNNEKNNRSDTPAIHHVLRIKNISMALTKSIELSKQYFDSSYGELFNSNLVRLREENITKDEFIKFIDYQSFKYRDLTLLHFLQNIFETKYNEEFSSYAQNLENEFTQLCLELEIEKKKPNNEEKIEELEDKKKEMQPRKKAVLDFKKNLNVESYEDPFNILQFLILFSQYKRNKILHGEHSDCKFFISDVNAKQINSLANVVFQTTIELVNQIDHDKYNF